MIIDEASELKLKAYAELLSKWNEKMDLVSSSEISRIYAEHIMDSVAAFGCIEVSRETPILDIGSGAGLPGVVFAILAPEIKLILLEPRDKRVTFLKECRRELKLENVEVVHGRLEDFKSERPVHGVQRAVGREVENAKLLGEIAPNSKLSFIVSTSWELPKDLGSQVVKDEKYMISGAERVGRVVTVRIEHQS